jgi:hypothetical protein
MLRKFIIVLVGVASLGSPAFAQERDGDGNRVPGLAAPHAQGGWERAYAGPQSSINGAEKEVAERLSRVH